MMAHSSYKTDPVKVAGSPAQPHPLPSHWTIIFKLMLYYIRTRFRNYPRYGYLKALARPFFRLLFLFAIMTLIKQQMGMDLLLVIASGLLPFYLFRGPALFLATSLPASRVVLKHPYVGHMHIILARFLLEAATVILSGVVIFCILIAVGMAPPPRDPLGLFLPSLALLLLGLGTGTLAAFTFPLSSIFGSIFRITVRVLYITSAIFFLGRALPPILQQWAAWNPVFHGIELFRESYFDIQHNTYINIWYPMAWGGGLLLLGIALERVLHAKLDEENPNEAEQSAAMDSYLI